MQVGDGIDGDDFAAINDDHLAAGLLHFGEDVGAEDDGVIAGETGDQLAGLTLLFRIEAGSGLIENEHGRIVNDSLGEADALPEAFGELADDGVAGLRDGAALADLLDAPVDLMGRDALEFGDKCEVIDNFHLRVERRSFGQVADALLDFHRLFENVESVQRWLCPRWEEGSR